ncbi:uncharacterized protein LOC135213740 [Macrobrachium nipponense]|uniref:uncharacterized protein LOC135213740 n=1 Tax=Macrobrachium nipponense TaxID=159736 RepID=UPI0030C7B8FF
MIKNLWRFVKAMSRNLFPREKLQLPAGEDCSSSMTACVEDWTQKLESLEDSSGIMITPKQDDTEEHKEEMQKKILEHFPWKKKEDKAVGKCGDNVGVLDLAVVEDYIVKDFGKLPLPSNRAFDVPKSNVIPCLLNGRDSVCSIAGDEAINIPVMTLEEVRNLGLEASVRPVGEAEDLRKVYGPLTIVGALHNIYVQLGEMDPLTFTFAVQDRDMFPRISLGNRFLAEHGAVWEFSSEGSRVSLKQQNADGVPEAPLYFEAVYRQRNEADRVTVQVTERGPSYVMADVSDRMQSGDLPELNCIRFDILGQKTKNIRVLKTYTLAYSDADVSLGKTFFHDAHAIVDYQERALYLKLSGRFQKIALERGRSYIGHDILPRVVMWQDPQDRGPEGKEPRPQNLPNDAVRLPEPGPQERPQKRPSFLRHLPEKRDDRRRRRIREVPRPHKPPAYKPERKIPRFLPKEEAAAAPRQHDWSQMSSASSTWKETPKKEKGHFIQDIL